MKTYTTVWVAREETALCLDVGVAILQDCQIIFAQVHNMDREERKKWLKWSKIGICVPLKDKDASEKDLHMANTLERLVTR